MTRCLVCGKIKEPKNFGSFRGTKKACCLDCEHKLELLIREAKCKIRIDYENLPSSPHKEV